MPERIDIERCIRAMKDLRVEGMPGPGERARVIEDAIRAIQKDGAGALADEYMGVKNYASFGDQRADCRYGYGPSHGHIVFRVGRARECKTTLGPDHVYLLECVRDFAGWYEDVYRTGNLCDTLAEYVRARERAAAMLRLLEEARVEAHAGVEVPSHGGGE